jgi:hypothetical protein
MRIFCQTLNSHLVAKDVITKWTYFVGRRADPLKRKDEG